MIRFKSIDVFLISIVADPGTSLLSFMPCDVTVVGIVWNNGSLLADTFCRQRGNFCVKPFRVQGP